MSYTVPPQGLAPVYRMDDFRTALDAEPPAESGEVWAEVMAAARLFGALRAAGMSVRFESGDGDSPPRICITDLHGKTIREISPAVACDPAALEAEAFKQDD